MNGNHHHKKSKQNKARNPGKNQAGLSAHISELQNNSLIDVEFI
jgi:hypothetical protein